MSQSTASLTLVHNGATQRLDAPTPPIYSPLQIPARADAHYVLRDETPASRALELHRQGPDLIIGGDQPWWVIEQFFTTSGTLASQARDGTLHTYATVHNLADGTSTHLEQLAISETAPLAMHGTAAPYATVPSPSLLDILDDVGAIQGSIAHLQATDDNRPTLQGNARPGDRILIKDGDRKLGEAVADAQGNWSFTPRTPLSEGRHDFTVQAQDDQGNLSDPSDVLSVVVDQTAPRRPSITELYDDQGQSTGAILQGGLTDDARPLVSGSAEPLSTVVLLDKGQEIGRTQALANGTWSLTPTLPLTPGPHSLTIIAVDQAGNASQPSDAFELQVLSAQVPAAPSIDALQDNAGALTGNIPRDSLTDDARPVIRGSAPAGLSITVYANGIAIGSTFADQNGQWSVTPVAALQNGTITLTAVAQSEAGNLSRQSLPYSFKLTSSLPDQPQLLEIRDDAGMDHGPIADQQATDDARPTFIGKGQAGQRILIHDQGQLVGETRVDSRGNWRFTPKSNLAEGEHSFTVAAMDATGASSTATPPHRLFVDTAPPARPIITGLQDDQGDLTGTIAPNGVTDDAQPVLTGTGEPRATVRIYDNGREIGRTTVDANGQWTFEPTRPLALGEHVLSARIFDPAGNTSALSDLLPFTVLPGGRPQAPTITAVMDDQGSITGLVDPGGETDDNLPLVRGTADANMVITLCANGQEIGRTTSNTSGQWSLEPSRPLPEGTITFTTTATSPAGNTSATSNSYTIVIDITAPGTPELQDIIDDVGAIQGSIPHLGTTDDTLPTLIGVGQPGERVLIRDNGQPLGEATGDALGMWQFTPPYRLAEGAHSFTILAVDKAGNLSPESVPRTLIVDTIAPDRPAITRVYDDLGDVTGPVAPGGTTDDTLPQVSGTAEAGATLVLYDNGIEIGRTKVNSSGTWSFEPASPLASGLHNLTAKAIDAAGNVSMPSMPHGFMLITGGRPPAPSIESLIDDQGDRTGPIPAGGITDDAQPQINGRGQPNTTLVLFDNGREIGRISVKNDGSWTFEPASPLANGPHTLTAQVVDAAGNSSPLSPGYGFTLVAPGQPNAPTIEQVYDDQGSITGNIPRGGATDDAQPLISGRAPANSTVTVTANGKVIGTAQADASGNWQLTPSNALGNGTQTLNATSTNSAGNTSAPSADYTIVVDTLAPNRPAITRVYDDQGDVTGLVAPGSTTDDAQPQVSGTAEAGATLALYDNGIEIGRTKVNSSGTWSFEPASPLASGLHNLTAKAIDAAGNVSMPSMPHGFMLITGGRPPAPSIESLIDDQGDRTGPIPAGGITDDAQPQINGRGQPNTTLVLFDNGREIGRISVKNDGSWTFEPASPLANGPHTLTAQVVDAAGNSSPLSPGYGFTLVAPGQPNAPTIEQVYDDQGSITGNIPRGGATDDAQPLISGRAPANSTVTVTANGKVIGTAQADASGNWQLTPSNALGNGTQTLNATSTNSAGNTSAPSADYTIVVDTLPPDTPTLQSVLDDVGPLQGPIPHLGSTDDNRPTLTGKGQPGDRILIRDNGRDLAEIVVDGSGNWRYTPPQPLADGQHDFSLRAVDPVGNVSAESLPHSIFIDTRGPDRPVIERVMDDQGSVTGPIAQGGVTDDNRPLISGTAEPLASLVIYDNGREITRTQADASGRWSVEPATPLADGTHQLSAIATDTVGNPSLPSANYGFTVDTLAPDRPVITRVFDDQGDITGTLNPGDTTDDARPLVSGTAEANTLLVLFDNGIEIGRTRVDAYGQWSIEPSLSLALGSHSLTAQATDPAGNTSTPSNTFPFSLVSAGRPPAPTLDRVYDDQGSITGNVPRGGVTDDTRPLIQGSASPGLTVLILADGKVIGSTVAGNDGRWAFEPNTDLAEGTANLSARTVSEAGNSSGDSTRYPIVIDTTPPGPATHRLMDDVGPVQGEIASGSVTDDNRPTLIGTAEPNGTVVIYDNYVEIGRTQAASNGSWSFTPAQPLVDGNHLFYTTVEDSAGNRSAESRQVNFVVDTRVPEATVLITQMTKDSGADTQDFRTNDGSAGRLLSGTVQGTLAAGERIQVSVDNGFTWQDAANLGNGRWGYTDHDVHLTDWTIQTRVIDDAGRTGPLQTQNVTLDQWVTPPTALSWANGVLTVNFDGRDFSVGSLIEATVDGTSITHRLSAQEIVNGRANLSAQNGGATPAVYGASMVDEVGNISHQLTISSALSVEQSFSAAGHYLPLLKDFSYDVGTMVITGERNDRNALQGIYGPNYRNPTLLPISKPVLMVADIVSLDLKVGFASRLQCRVSENHFMNALPPGEYDTTRFFGTFSLNFYNEQGAMVHSHSVQFNGRQFGEDLDIRMFAGVTFSKVTLQVSSQYAFNQSFITLDDIRFEVASGNYTRLYEQNFDNTFQANLNYANKAIDLGGFVIRDEGLRTTAQQGIFTETWIKNSHYTLSTPVTGSALFITDTVALELKSTSANRFTAKLGDLLGESVNLTFYDANGKTVHFLNLRNDSANNTLHTIDARLPNGQTFTKVKVQVFNDPGIEGKAPLVWLDELKFHDVTGVIGGTPSGSTTTDLVSPSSEQSVQTAQPYYGGDNNDTFLVADVRVLNSAGASINGGEGIDCITLTGAGQVFDFAALANKVRSVEVLDITGSGKNVLKVSVGDVLSQGQTDLFHGNGHVQMMVKGDAGDLVQLQKLPGAADGGRWQNQGNLNLDGVGYAVWQHSTLEAELLVQMGVTTQLA